MLKGLGRTNAPVNRIFFCTSSAISCLASTTTPFFASFAISATRSSPNSSERGVEMMTLSNLDMSTPLTIAPLVKVEMLSQSSSIRSPAMLSQISLVLPAISTFIPTPSFVVLKLPVPLCITIAKPLYLYLFSSVVSYACKAACTGLLYSVTACRICPLTARLCYIRNSLRIHQHILLYRPCRCRLRPRTKPVREGP